MAHKEEIILKKLLWLGDRYQALENLDKAGVSVLKTPISELLKTAFPNQPWHEYLNSELMLNLSFRTIELEANAAVNLYDEARKEKTMLLQKFRSICRRLSHIVDEVSKERGLSFLYSSMSENSVVAGRALIRLWSVLTQLELDTPTGARMFLRGVSHNRAKYSSSQYLFSPRNLGRPYMVADFLAFMVRTWYTRYGNDKEVMKRQEKWHFEMSYYDRLRHNLISMIWSMAREAKCIGKSRFSVEVDLLCDDELGAIYTALFSKFTMKLAAEGLTKSRKTEELAEHAGPELLEFVESTEKELDALWTEVDLPDFGLPWDRISIEDFSERNPEVAKRLMEIMNGD